MYYIIEEIPIFIDERFILSEKWNKFLHYGTNNRCLINIRSMNKHSEVYLIECYSVPENIAVIYKYQNTFIFCNDKCTEIFILGSYDEDSINVFTNQIFYTHAIQRRMVQIHSSMIDHHGNGLLFLGPSGIGKTTMAELWNQYRSALIINGDMNFVQETEKGFLGWGTPWHGSSPYCENTNVPVRALVVLKQADRNSIRELDGFEKVQLVSNNVIYPTWLENGMELCLDVLDHLLRALPVYELSCRPDEEAVALTEKTIFGENRKW